MQQLLAAVSPPVLSVVDLSLPQTPACVFFYTSTTHPSHPPCQPLLQDAWAVKERLGGGEVMMLGVFDGHGAEGKVVSNFLATTLHKILARSPHCKV
jgi:serine/threonine protein phosphatase PrpC